MRARILAAIVAVVVGGSIWRLRSRPAEVSAGAQPAPAVRPAPAVSIAAAPAAAPGSASPAAADLADSIGGAAPYPVDLNALRARLPDNRFWLLGAPTSDPAVAKQRAARAERDNAALGRVVSGEASADEVRAYYAERRAISRDYLQLAEIVLAEKGEALPPRDRGAFELSANLHRARLQQIDRDESDALARRAAH
jgi:hypothetical protein